MYCTGQTPPSILNASFGFFALVRIFLSFFSFILFLSWVRNWICWFVLFFLPHPPPLRPVARKKNTCMEDGFALAGVFGVWSSWGGFCFCFLLLYGIYTATQQVRPLCAFAGAIIIFGFFVYLRAYILSPPM